MLRLLATILFLAPLASAQIALEGDVVTVIDFNGIGAEAGAALPADVRVQTLPGVREVGRFADAVAVTSLRGGNNLPADATPGAYNFGSGDSTSARDRAVGFVLGEGVGSGVVYMRLRNTSSESITRLPFWYSTEVYRSGLGSNRTELLFSTDGETFSAYGASSGTAQSGAPSGFPDAPRGSSGFGGDAQSIPSVGPGAVFYVAWMFSAAEGVAPEDVGAVALDDVFAGLEGATYDVLVPDHLERTFGPIPAGGTSDAHPLNLLWYLEGISPSDQPAMTVTGTDADAFTVTFGGGGTTSTLGFYTYAVAFSPTQVGAHEATLTLSSDGDEETILLQGEGSQNTDAAPAPRTALGLTLEGPNPTRATLRLGVTAPTPTTLDVFDATGRLVTQRTVSRSSVVELDVSGWPAGVYTVRARSGLGVATRPVVVAR